MLRYVFRDCSITSLTVKLSYYNLITSTKFERDPYFWISTGLLNAFNASLRLLINFTSTWFLMFSMVFPKTAVFINLKNSFSDSFLVFVYSFVSSLMCFFNQGSFLKLILLWIFLIPRFSNQSLRSKWEVVMQVMKLFWILEIHIKNARNFSLVDKVKDSQAFS